MTLTIFWVSNLVQAFLGAALGIVGVFFVEARGGASSLFPGVSLFQVLGWICLFVGAILMMRVVAMTARDHVTERK